MEPPPLPPKPRLQQQFIDYNLVDPVVVECVFFFFFFSLVSAYNTRSQCGAKSLQ